MKYLIAGLLRGLVFGLLWVFFAGWDADYAVYGIVSVVATTALSLALLRPRGRVKPARWPRRSYYAVLLAAWFLWQSAKGGVDVARRAATPTPDIEPAVVVAPVGLPPGHGRQVAMLLMNLMPGSMIQRGPHTTGLEQPGGGWSPSSGRGAEDAVVEIHTLSRTLNPAMQWRQLQERAARAFS